MSESRGALASKVCLVVMLAGGFVILAAAFPVHAATGDDIPDDGPGILLLMMVVALGAMAAILGAVLRPRGVRTIPAKIYRR